MQDKRDIMVLAAGAAVSLIAHAALALALPFVTDRALPDALEADNNPSLAARDKADEAALPEPKRPEVKPDQARRDEKKAPEENREKKLQDQRELAEKNPELYRPGADDGDELSLAWIDYESFEKLIAKRTMNHEQAAVQATAAPVDEGPLITRATDPGVVAEVNDVAIASSAAASEQPSRGQGGLTASRESAAAKGLPDATGSAALLREADAGADEPAREQPSREQAAPDQAALEKQASSEAETTVDDAESASDSQADEEPIATAEASSQETPETASNEPAQSDDAGVDSAAATAEEASEGPSADQQWGESIEDEKGRPTILAESSTAAPLGEKAVDQAKGVAPEFDPAGDSAQQEAATPPQPMAGALEDRGFVPADPAEELAADRQSDAVGRLDSEAQPSLQPDARAPQPEQGKLPANQLPAEAQQVDDQGEAATQQLASAAKPAPDGQPVDQTMTDQGGESDEATRAAEGRSIEPAAADRATEIDSEESPQAEAETETEADSIEPTEPRVAMADASPRSATPAAQQGRADGDVRGKSENSQADSPSGGVAVTAVPTATPLDDREASIAGRDEKPDTVKPGGVRVISGVRTITFAPPFSVVSLTSALPNNPLVAITFNKEGKAVDARIVESTRYPDIDSVILASLYRWKQEGENLKKRDGPATVHVRIMLVAER